MGIKDLTLGTLPPIHKGKIFVSYALEISQGINIKNLPRLCAKSVQSYRRSSTSHTTNNGQREPRLRYTLSGLPLDGAKHFLVFKKLLSQMSKWEDGRDEALPITTAIFGALKYWSSLGGTSSEAAYIFDAICMGLQTVSRCSKCCRGNPTSQSEKFCKVPMSAYVGTFVGYPIAFINADFYFLLEYSHFVSPANDLAKSIYLIVRFRFDKGGTRNIQERTFCRFPADILSFFFLLTDLRTLDRWTSCNLNPLTYIFCCWKMKVVTFINYSIVTQNLREATLQAYPNPHHFYNLHLKYFRTHSVRVIVCLILVVLKLSDATI